MNGSYGRTRSNERLDLFNGNAVKVNSQVAEAPGLVEHSSAKPQRGSNSDKNILKYVQNDLDNQPAGAYDAGQGGAIIRLAMMPKAADQPRSQPAE